MNALLEESAMAMRLFNGLRTISGDKLLPTHGCRTTAAPPRGAHDPVGSENRAGTTNSPVSSTDMPGVISAAMALENIEAQEDRIVTSFLFTYVGFVFFLAILFVFACAPS